MKKFIYGLMAVAALGMTSCDDFLNDNRFPLDQQTNSPDYWNTENNVNLQINGLYPNFTGYGSGATWSTNFYNHGLSDDQTSYMQSGIGVAFALWNFQQAPTSSSVWNSTYTVLRRINTIIEGVEGSTLAEGYKKNILGIARMNRAYQYWDLVRCYGDVPLIKGVINTGSEELYMGRTPRNEVMDYVLEDLNYACANITTEKSKTEFSRDMALAMKAEICLFEAAFAKYHQNNTERANKFYNEVVNAAGQIISKYPLATDYRSIYNSYYTAQDGIPSILSNPEVIFCRGYAEGQLGNSLVTYLSTRTEIAGINKDAFDAFLFKDGKPLALTSENTTDVAQMDAEGNVTIAHMLAVRDGRLAQTIEPYLAFGSQRWARVNSDALASVTGYLVRKYVNENIPYANATTDGKSYICAPVYWGSRVMLAYAEAKAELGTLNDGDLAQTINKIFTRAGLPVTTVAALSAMNDPANNMGVSSLIWEIRRCRRCELMMDENIRYWDLIRWHQLDKLDTVKYPNIMLGANLSAIPDDVKDGMHMDANGYINVAQSNNGTLTRVFTDREYFYPLGTNELALNPNLTQNPGW